MKQDNKSTNGMLSLAVCADIVGLSYLCGMLLANARWSDIYASWSGVLMLLCAIVVSVVGVIYTTVAIRARSQA